LAVNGGKIITGWNVSVSTQQFLQRLPGEFMALLCAPFFYHRPDRQHLLLQFKARHKCGYYSNFCHLYRFNPVGQMHSGVVGEDVCPSGGDK
jgi:hypothetical protein